MKRPNNDIAACPGISFFPEAGIQLQKIELWTTGFVYAAIRIHAWYLRSFLYLSSGRHNASSPFISLLHLPFTFCFWNCVGEKNAPAFMFSKKHNRK
jgi:hypothetical protein